MHCRMNIVIIISLFFPALIKAQETYKSYQVYRVLIAMESKADLKSGHERYKEGDIIDARPEMAQTEGLGTAEVNNFIALRVQGFSRDIMDSLAVKIDGFDKRRFSIRFSDLKTQWPSFDTTQVHVLDDDLKVVLKNGLFNIEGLVWDKLYQRYWR